MLDKIKLFIISILGGNSDCNNTGNEIATNNKKVGEVAATTSPRFKAGAMIKTALFETSVYIEIR